MASELHEWHEFYLLLGSAAAALLALLFVAVSVGVGFVTERNQGNTRTYMSPIVVHFAAVLFLSAVALAPVKSAGFTVTVIALAGIAGLGVSAFTTIRSFLHGGRLVTRFDRFAYGVIPDLAYLGIIASALLISTGWHWSLEFFAGALLLLLLINIRNAWDLILTVVRQLGRRRR